MTDVDNITTKNIEKHNSKWLQIPDHPYIILTRSWLGLKRVRSENIIFLKENQNKKRFIRNISKSFRDLR